MVAAGGRAPRATRRDWRPRPACADDRRGVGVPL